MALTRAMLLRRLLVITAGVTGAALGGCGKTVKTSKCYFAGPALSQSASAGATPVAPACADKDAEGLAERLSDVCQEVIEVTGDPVRREATTSTGTSCCYDVEAEEKTCEIGRPLVIEGVVRTSRLSRRSGWGA